jgi:hypothetical protein
VKITNSRVYDTLKSLALVWLPALGTLYFTLAGVWGASRGSGGRQHDHRCGYVLRRGSAYLKRQLQLQEGRRHRGE